MITLQRILVGHSLFPDGEIALRSAAVLAQRADATFVHGFGGCVLFLHVLDIASYVYPAAYGAAPIIIPPITPDDLEPDWQHFLADLPLDGVAWEKQTREGRAAPAIVAATKDHNADLLVMGTYGRTGMAHVLLGSVAEAVARLTNCSVMTVRPDAFSFALP